MSDGETQRIVDAVADATRTGMGRVSPAELDHGWERLESALSDGKYPSVPIMAAAPRWWLRGFAVAAAALLLGFATHRWLAARSDASLHYVIEGAAVGPGETIRTVATASARMLFSDDSRIRIAPATKVSVLALDAHGSRIALADGALDVEVRHRQGTSWRFEAGPFSVKVVGTSFHLAYEAERGRLALQILTGRVEARGPSDDRVFTLRAGESLELFAGVAPASSPTTPVPPSAKPVPPEVTSPLPEAATPRVAPAPSSRHHATHAARAEVSLASGGWARLIAQGDFAAVVKDAEQRGLDATLASAAAADLTSLAALARVASGATTLRGRRCWVCAHASPARRAPAMPRFSSAALPSCRLPRPARRWPGTKPISANSAAAPTRARPWGERSRCWRIRTASAPARRRKPTWKGSRTDRRPNWPGLY
jgi:pyruvate/2-oxoglutarate dehydrogenase complex dihydrolipoamide acyltransferase (E2) component